MRPTIYYLVLFTISGLRDNQERLISLRSWQTEIEYEYDQGPLLALTLPQAVALNTNSAQARIQKD